MAMSNDVLVPDVGGEEVEVIEVCVSVGDSVEAEDSLITVESDKASMDIPAPFAGKITEILVAVGDKVGQDKLIMKMESADSEDANTEDAKSEESSEKAEQAPTPAPAEAEKSETEAAKPASGGSVIEVTVPDIGDASDVDVIEILVKAGDSVEAEDGLITLETDKATMDVPAPKSGVVKELRINVGDKVSKGSLVLLLETSDGGSASEESAAAPAPEAEAEPAAAASGSSVIEVSVPDIGDAADVDVIEVLVSVGDSIDAETGLITLETDKATMDVPSPKAGVVKEMLVKTGDKVSKGSPVIMLEVAGETPAAKSEPAPAAKAQAPAPSPAAPAPKAPPVPHHPSAGEKPKSGSVYASPSIRRLAREFGVDLTQVSGSGRKGRILKEDVQSYVKYELSRPKANAASSTAAGAGGLQVLAQPKVDFSKFGEIEEQALTRIQKLSGPNLHRNWVTIPHVTQFEDADITDLEAFRKEQNAINEKRKLGVKITPLVFIMKAAASALLEYPTFNSSLSESGEALILKKYVHIGIAVDTPNGLVVPVVRDVDKKGVIEISRELMEISQKARDGKLKAADMQGGCFTISSLGGIGGTAFTPIVNAPEVAILGVSKSDMKPKWNGKEFEPRLTLPLSLSYDHRVIDGALAARFAVHLSEVLSDIRRLVM
ncbi:dihydrolipoyllysine-residue acetyltransferase [Planctobacterium marinum]|uniref:dihydrolipoyllysine-residue acetyltransferase n=1 Tax=Planctobacterium marinum TaxID=1631968 RepID=UPI001E41AD55|nr:dihydrolipoyllysine-residue acetyltransferase [Planctobacterium marinum]MCC2605412.1 dihydrolipoyllysine-residue acetyltransferase [Planctobacterium marinum]